MMTCYQEELEKASENLYIKDLLQNCSTKLLQESRIWKEYLKNGNTGLFHLFLNRTLLATMLKWTNIELKKKGKAEICMEKLLAYIGLELAMSVLTYNEISEYWATGHFQGHKDFKAVMS